MIDQEINSRMMQFRQNPQALQQRYSQTQDLLDLLALQKLKSEKEAAARDMQLKMAQQQNASGMPPTIKGQREQQVLDLTKQELMLQRAALAKKQQNDQQQNLQEVMQKGLPQAPAPNMQNLAGGGIVAFGQGGDIQHFVEGGPTLSDTLAQYEQRRKEIYDQLYSVQAGTPTRPRREPIAARLGGNALKNELDKLDQAIAQIKSQMAAPAAAQPAAAPAQPPAAPAQPPVAAARPPVAAAQPPVAQGPQGPQGPQKLPTLPGGISTVAPAMDPQLADALKRAQGANPEEAFQQRQKEFINQTAETPEEAAIRQQGEAGRQQAYQQMTDPEQQKREALFRGLMSAAGGGGFAAAGTGMLNAMEQQRKAQQEAFDRYQNPREAYAKMERERRAGSFERGEKAEKSAADLFSHGITSGVQARGQNLQYSNNMIAQQVELLKANIMREANQIAKQSQSEERTRMFYAATKDKLERQQQNIEKLFNQTYAPLLQIESFGTLSDAQKRQLEAARAKKDADMMRLRLDMEPVLEQAAGLLGLPSTARGKVLGVEPSKKP